MAALASLTADYTDSEEEEDRSKEAEPEKEPVAPPSSTSLTQKFISANVTPSSGAGSNPASARSTPTKKMRLVSYIEEGADDDDDDDDDGGGNDNEGGTNNDGSGDQNRPLSSDNPDVVPMDLDSENDGEDSGEAASAAAAASADAKKEDLNESVDVEAWSGGVQLPPEPAGHCDPKLQEKINHMYKRKMSTNYDINTVIQNMKSFRNPSIYEKLIQLCNVTESGTNFPKELYDGHLFGKESYYDELAKVQAIDMEKREKAAKNRVSSRPEVPAANLANLAPVAKRPDDSSGKRRSKWDQAAPQIAAAIPTRPPTNPNVPLPNVPAPQVVSAAASLQVAKTISAFGPLKK